MGWASGGGIACAMVDLCQSYVVGRDSQVQFLVKAFESLDNHDWDTHDEAIPDKNDPMYSVVIDAFKKLYPDYDWDY